MDFNTSPETNNMAINKLNEDTIEARTSILGSNPIAGDFEPMLSMFTNYQSSSSSTNSPAPTEHSFMSEGFDSDSLPAQNLQEDLSWSPRNNSASPSLSTGSNSSGGSTKKKKGIPYIPSYMDLSNGPEPCVVCGDAATGYHYRCMTCEGCKGFFRRTVQKNLSSGYQCKWSSQCVVDKTSRNNCQECRFKKCLAVGMAPDLVLNDRQRVAKRKLIEENREKRKTELIRMHMKHTSCDVDMYTDADKNLIKEIESAYGTLIAKTNSNQTVNDLQSGQPDVWGQMSAIISPFVIKLIHFAKKIPGFLEQDLENQLILLKASCMEVLCLRIATSYNPEKDCLCFPTGATFAKESMLTNSGLVSFLDPLLGFSAGLYRLKLDNTEVALLAAVLLMQSDRTGLSSPETVEQLQDTVLGVYKRYIAVNRPSQPVHWAKVLMKVTDLRTIAGRYGDRVLGVKLSNPEEIPPLFLDMFEGTH